MRTKLIAAAVILILTCGTARAASPWYWDAVFSSYGPLLARKAPGDDSAWWAVVPGWNRCAALADSGGRRMPHNPDEVAPMLGGIDHYYGPDLAVATGPGGTEALVRGHRHCLAVLGGLPPPY